MLRMSLPLDQHRALPHREFVKQLRAKLATHGEQTARALMRMGGH